MSRYDAKLRDLARSVASWVLLLALSIDVLALALEPIFMTSRGAPVSAGIAAVLASVALSLLFATAIAVPAAMVHALVRLVRRQKRPWGFLWPVPLVLLAWLIVTTLAPHRVIHTMSLVAGQRILASLLAVALLVMVGIARIRRGRLRVGLGVGVTVLAVAVDVLMPPEIAREPRDLLWVVTVLSLAAAAYPVRRHAVTLPHERVSRWLGVLVVLSIPLLFLAPVISPDWRVYASNGGAFAPRMARFCRTLVDLDGDGVSPVLWGTDCDDANAEIQPAIRERMDGIDHNCNGKLRPVAPTLEQRGLSPAFGEPDAPVGEIDRVVLVTIDCLRNDAFTSEVTPNMVKLAERGVRFAKLYSQGARTAMSLPYVLRGSTEAPAIAELLDRDGVSTTAIFGYRHSTLESNVFDGFQIVRRPELLDHRIRAPELTDLALADLRDPAHAHAHFLWLHYFDAHGPRARRVLPAGVPSFPPIRGETEGDESALYLSELSFVDTNVGRLFDGIEQIDGFKRTLLVVTNDHGEGFGRHGVYAHGVSAFESIVHAPGFIVAPFMTPAVYRHVAAQRDIAATVLGAFGLVARHPEVEKFGWSWLRLRGAGDAASRPLHEFVVSYETTIPLDEWFDAPMASIVDDHAKLSVTYTDGLLRFYDLDVDPAEDHQLAGTRPADVARYRDELETFRDIDAPPN